MENETFVAQTQPEVLPATSEVPMIASLRQLFGDISTGMIRSSEAQERVARAEKAAEVAQDTIKELREERGSLKAKFWEVEAHTKALAEELEQTKANLTYHKDNLVRTQRALDELSATYSALVKEHEHAADDRDLARLERDDWQDKCKRLVEELEKAKADLAEARKVWFMQEDQMTRSIASLTAERNSFRERFDQCKSFAARIMQLDRVGPEPVEQKFDA